MVSTFHDHVHCSIINHLGPLESDPLTPGAGPAQSTKGCVYADPYISCLCVQIRKQQKDHAELIEDYRTKQQQQRALLQPSTAPPVVPQTLSQPMGPMQPHLGGTTPTCVPNVSPGWTQGGRAPGIIAQRMPPALPNAPQAPSHTQAPPTMAQGFTAGPRVPTGGPSGTSGEGAPPPRQVREHFDKKCADQCLDTLVQTSSLRITFFLSSVPSGSSGISVFDQWGTTRASHWLGLQCVRKMLHK